MTPPPPPVLLADLVAALTRAARAPGRKQLFCAPDVGDALAGALPPEAAPPEPWDLAAADAGVIGRLLAVDIIPAPDSPPGMFRLVCHAQEGRGITCEVHGTTVSHASCPVVMEGVLTL